MLKCAVTFLLLLCSASFAHSSTLSLSESWKDIARHYIDTEFQPSTLSKQQQLEELTWFAQAAKPYKHLTVRVVSERIDTHFYESYVLAKAFYRLTGIRVIHEITGEDDVIKKMQAQIATGKSLYDAYINDSDLIGYHIRSDTTLRLDAFMQNEGADVTLPSLDLDDFIGLSFTTSPDGHLYQLPDQQFANLYWYRADWFARPELQKKFYKIYGYQLNVPQNWQAYEDIAEFFTLHVRELDGQRVWGHMDYGRRDPSLGWRISDAWLSLAGTGDKGLPNGIPVDDWGIRVEDCRPVGASVARGGALNSPAAIYAVEKYVEWLNKYAPPEAKTMNFTEAGNWLIKGNIAQQIWWYSAFTAALTKPGTPIVEEDGTPKWRMAPSPKGAYWEEGMKLGYQDAGSWTFLKTTPMNKIKAAWLYAQFLVSKTISLKKSLVGLTPIRLSDIESEAFTQKAKKLGGLVEFYRSKGRNFWTPTGSNVPDYTKLSNFWWQHVGDAVSGNITVRNAMNRLANDFDNTLDDMSQEQISTCSPLLNPISEEKNWLDKPGSPKARRINFSPPSTLPYEEAINAWE
jgi:glycerol transport system substrate-binding protein